MAAFCFAYGAYVFSAGTDAARLTAGPVVFYLGSICIALYCTAATIIRQIIGTYTAAAKYLFPAIGYAFAVLTLISGAFIISSHWPGALVTGHVVCGLGLITACVATAATSSTRFSLIPKNSADDSFSVNPAGFTARNRHCSSSSSRRWPPWRGSGASCFTCGEHSRRISSQEA